MFILWPGRPFLGGYSNPLTCVRHLCMVIVYHTPFISIHELKHCLNLRPGKHGFPFFLAFQHLGNFIMPASFAHEFIPHINFSFRRLASHPKTRLQNRFVCEALMYVLNYYLVTNSEE